MANIGWECPRCHQCYAPSVKKCKECKPVQVARPIYPEYTWPVYPRYVPYWYHWPYYSPPVYSGGTLTIQTGSISVASQWPVEGSGSTQYALTVGSTE